MSVFHNNALIGSGGGAAAAAAAGPTKSLRFNGSDTPELTRTPSSAGNTKTFTISFWTKRSFVSASGFHMVVQTDTQYHNIFRIFFSQGKLRVQQSDQDAGGSVRYDLLTTQLFRDPSAWYHIVVAVDTTQSTASDRVKLYLNGAQITAFDTANYPSQNQTSGWNDTEHHRIGREFTTTYGNFYNYEGYLADFYNIDGSQLDPTSFGAYDDNGVWQAAEYSGTYGTNGFHLLDFENESTVGHDSSGNENDFTANNISTSAGAGNDVLFDVPTNGTQSDTGAGGEVSGNYATLNALNKGSNITLKEGNLGLTSSSHSTVLSTIAVTAGMKTYMETTVVTDGVNGWGLTINPQAESGYSTTSGKWWVYDNGVNFSIQNQSTSTPYGVRVNVNDILQLAIDYDAGKAFVGINNTWINSTNGTNGNPSTGANPTFTFSTTDPIFPLVHLLSGELAVNFGQRAWAYSAPTNFKALCTTNLPTPTIADGSDYFDISLWTGTGSSRSITGLSFSPDWVWIKPRNAAYNNALFDTVRGSGKRIKSNDSVAEDTDNNTLSGFNSDGFSLGTNNGVNQSSKTYVAWNWDAGSSTASNTDGSITASVRANQTAGFSIVSYSGPGSSATIGHGLNAEVEFIIAKNRSFSDPWAIYHVATGANKLVYLDGSACSSVSGYWGSGPTSSVFGIGNYNGVARSGNDFIAYCFAPVAGFSHFTSFEGTGSSDPVFVHCGFRPAWILKKNIDTGSTNWYIHDTARDTFNVCDAELKANSDAAENTFTALDILSNGFAMRTSNSNHNGSGDTYIVAAFAENPFSSNGGLAR